MHYLVEHDRDQGHIIESKEAGRQGVVEPTQSRIAGSLGNTDVQVTAAKPASEGIGPPTVEITAVRDVPDQGIAPQVGIKTVAVSGRDHPGHGQPFGIGDRKIGAAGAEPTVEGKPARVEHQLERPPPVMVRAGRQQL